MELPDVKAEIVQAEVWTGLIGDPPRPYSALQLKIQSEQGQQVLPWLALSPELAGRLVELLQTNLGDPQQPPAGSTLQ